MHNNNNDQMFMQNQDYSDNNQQHAQFTGSFNRYGILLFSIFDYIIRYYLLSLGYRKYFLYHTYLRENRNFIVI